MGRARRVVRRAPFGGGRFVADNSAWARAAHPAVRDEWRVALLGGQILTTPVVMLEVLFSARDGPGFDDVESALRALDVLPLTPETGELAIRSQRQLARVHPLYHRSAKIPDLSWPPPRSSPAAASSTTTRTSTGSPPSSRSRAAGSPPEALFDLDD